MFFLLFLCNFLVILLHILSLFIFLHIFINFVAIYYDLFKFCIFVDSDFLSYSIARIQLILFVNYSCFCTIFTFNFLFSCFHYVLQQFFILIIFFLVP